MSFGPDGGSAPGMSQSLAALAIFVPLKVMLQVGPRPSAHQHRLPGQAFTQLTLTHFNGTSCSCSYSFAGGGTSIDGRGPAFAGPLGMLGICLCGCEQAAVSNIKNPRMGVMGMGISTADVKPP